MEFLELIYHNIQALGIHRYGWWFIATLLLVPGIVGVNLCQSYLTRLYRGEQKFTQILMPFCLNLMIALTSAATIIIAVKY